MKLLHYPFLKLGALFLAFIVWAIVVMSQTYTWQYAFPLRIANLPSQYQIVDDLPQEVKVTIKASGEKLLRLLLEPGEVTIDASGYKYGRRFHNITKEEVNIPQEGIEIVSIDKPKKISFLVDEVQQKKVPIATDLNLIPKNGYFIKDSIEVFPTTVLVSGPRSIIDDIKALKTEADTLKGISGEIREDILQGTLRIL